MSAQTKNLYFEKGFALEEPNIILLWNKPLDKIAKISGGIWAGDRYVWNDVKYLNGLNYSLFSENGRSQNNLLKRISANIGITSQGWEDAATLDGYAKTSEHLTKLFGEPQMRETNPEVPVADGLSWKFGKVEVYLDVIEQFTYKCYLNVELKASDKLNN